MRRTSRGFLLTALTTLVAALSGCSGTVAGLFNPEFLTAVGVGPKVAALPGDAPSVLVTIENRTTRPIAVVVQLRLADDSVDTFTAEVQSDDKTAQTLVCPVKEMTIGDLSDLSQPGAFIRLGAGTVDDATLAVEPFGVLLKEGVNYNCGDGVTFTVLPSGATRSGYQTYAFIQRADQ